MTIPAEQFAKFKQLQSRGDVKKIAAENGLHYQTIVNVMRSGKASPKVYEAIAKYFAIRENDINQYQ